MTTTETAVAGSPPVEGTLGRQPALDGLRAIAVVAVLLFHNRWGTGAADWLPGGFLGVDVFFVLSGFLITGILLADHARTGSAISRRFWYRRTRRLLPAMLLMLAIVAAFAVFRAPAWDLHAIRWRGITTALYVENWYTIIAHPGPAPVSHAWSLSIEEQWYLVWPFLLAGLLFVTGRRRGVLAAVLATLAVGSAFLMARDAHAGEMIRAYESTLGRAGELLVGALLALLVARRRSVTGRAARTTVELLGVAGAAWILWSFATVRDTSDGQFRGGSYGVAVATAFVILAAIQPDGPVLRRVLAARSLVAIGLVSYGLYLFHIPIYGWIDHPTTGLGPVALTVLRLAVVGAIAVASYHLLEMPFRAGAFRGRGHWLAIGGTIGIILVLLVATIGGRPQRAWETQRAAFAKFATQVSPGTPRLLVAGEADALTLALADRQGSRTDGAALAFAAAPVCAIAGERAVVGDLVFPRSRCDRWSDTYRAGTAFDPDAVVLMAGTSALLDHRVAGRTLRVGDPRYAEELIGRLDEALRVLGGDSRPLVVTTVSCTGLADDDRSGTATALRDPTRRAWVNGVWRSWAASHPGRVRLVDLDPLLCPGGDPRPVGPDGPLRAPNGTLTRAGQLALRSWLVEHSGLRRR